MTFDVFIVDPLLRWGHILATIAWIGGFYALHLVVCPVLESTLNADEKRRILPAVLGKGLNWIRWSSLISLIFGIGLLGFHMAVDKTYVADSGGLVGRGRFVMWGMTLGTMMWASVWFIIAPNQKKILASIAAGETPDPKRQGRVRAAAKFNMFASAGTLLIMTMTSHFATHFHYGFLGLAIVAGILAMVIMRMLTGSKS